MLLLSNWCPFSPLGRRTCPYPRRWECPAHCGSEARNVLRPWHFSLNFDALGWLLTDPVAMVSAKCCLSYGECAKVCFRGVLKPQNVFKMCWRPFCFHKIWWKYTLKPQKRRIVRLALGRGENSLVFYGFLYSSIWLNFVIFWHFLHKLWRQKQMVLIMAAIGPKGLIPFCVLQII